MNRQYKKHYHLGPGGMKCTCCAPAPGKSRKAVRKCARRRFKQELEKELREEETTVNEITEFIGRTKR